ncbi:MAG: response regulator [Anaerolineae bacterium]|nr:response regulator [Anaerolineae bacterium]
MAGPEATEKDKQQVVLIADADRALAQILAATLAREGVQIALAHDGYRALELAGTLHPSVLISEVVLPGKSGFEVCAALKRDPATASIRIIILTSRADLRGRMASVTAGADVYLTKPFSPVYLVTLVNEILAGRTVGPPSRWPPPSAAHADQWLIYAYELKELVTQQRATRKALEEAQKRLERLNKLQMEFVGVLSHELLTPFGAVGLALEVLQQQSRELSPEYRQAVDNLSTEIAALHRMINGVVKFAELLHKRREPELAFHQLDQVIPPAVEPVAVLAQARGVDFRCLVPSSLPPVFADRSLLSEAVFQMAHNAVKFNKPGGRAWVRAFQEDGWLVIEVKDTGIGLTPDRLALLGQPFEQAADSLRRGREGLGVGWAFVGYVARVHSGRTSVESPGPGKGSTFRLLLPIVTDTK